FMVYPRQLFLTKAHSLLPVSGNSCMHLWVLSLFVAQPIILRPMVKLSESIKFLRIYLEPMCSEQFNKFVDMVHRLSINMPLLDALQVPTYSRYFKDIMGNKREIPPSTVKLT